MTNLHCIYVPTKEIEVYRYPDGEVRLRIYQPGVNSGQDIILKADDLIAAIGPDPEILPKEEAVPAKRKGRMRARQHHGNDYNIPPKYKLKGMTGGDVCALRALMKLYQGSHLSLYDRRDIDAFIKRYNKATAVGWKKKGER